MEVFSFLRMREGVTNETNDKNIVMRFILPMLRENACRNEKRSRRNHFVSSNERRERPFLPLGKRCKEQYVVKHPRILCRDFARPRRVYIFKEEFQEVVDSAKKKIHQDAELHRPRRGIRSITYHKLIQGGQETSSRGRQRKRERE